MKTLFALITLSLAFSGTLFAQSEKEIVLKTNFFTGMKFYQNGSKVLPKTALDLMKSNPEAYDLLKKSNSQAGGATVVSAIGGVLIGWPLGTAIGGGDPNWAIAGAGLGIVAVSAVIYSSAEKKAKQAVSLYNDGLTSSSRNGIKTTIHLVARPTGIGFSLSF